MHGITCMLVLFLAQTCTIPQHMKERASRTFFLSSLNVLSCIVTVIWPDQTNCSALSLLLSKLSGLAALVHPSEWPPMGMLEMIACATDDMALMAASMVSP